VLGHIVFPQLEVSHLIQVPAFINAPVEPDTT